MKISSIEIRRFRSIGALDLLIDQSNNYITICGANNTGKTNVLRALNIFFRPTEYVVSDDSPNHKYHGSRGSKAYPEITVTIDDQASKYTIRREFGSNDLSSTTGTQWSEGKEKQMDEEECEKVLAQFTFFYIPSINISFPKLINNLIDDVYDLEYQKVRFRGLKQQLKKSFEDYTNGVLDILNQLAAEMNPTFQDFNSNWSVGFENTADVQKFKDLISEDIDFYLNDKSNRNIEGKGSGLQRLGYILLHSRIIQKLKKKNIILCIDEPDVYLHQSLQRKLKTHLAQVAEKCQLILTTHSPVFIDAYKLNNVFLLDLEIGQEIKYERSNKTFYRLDTQLVNLYDHDGLRKIKDYLGISDDDYELLDPYNIIVEGECDKKYLSEISAYFGVPACKIISANGVTNIVKYLDFYNSFYKDRDFKPTIVVLIDNDSAGRNEFKIITKKIRSFEFLTLRVEFTPTCFGETPSETDLEQNRITANYEIEDFVYPEILLGNANELIGKKGLKKIRFTNLETKLQARSFKENGVLYNIDLLKNEKNPESGYTIGFSTEGVKAGLSGLFSLKGNKQISDAMVTMDTKYPAVRTFLNRIMNSKAMK